MMPMVLQMCIMRAIKRHSGLGAGVGGIQVASDDKLRRCTRIGHDTDTDTDILLVMEIPLCGDAGWAAVGRLLTIHL